MQLEFHAVLVGKTVVVEREQNQAVVTNVRSAVFNAHPGAP